MVAILGHLIMWLRDLKTINAFLNPNSNEPLQSRILITKFLTMKWATPCQSSALPIWSSSAQYSGFGWNWHSLVTSGSNLFPPRMWTDKLSCCWWNCYELCYLVKESMQIIMIFRVSVRDITGWDFPRFGTHHFFWAGVSHYVFKISALFPAWEQGLV